MIINTVTSLTTTELTGLHELSLNSRGCHVEMISYYVPDLPTLMNSSVPIIQFNSAHPVASYNFCPYFILPSNLVCNSRESYLLLSCSLTLRFPDNKAYKMVMIFSHFIKSVYSGINEE